MAEVFPGTGGGEQSPAGDPTVPSALVAPMIAEQAVNALTSVQRDAAMNGSVQMQQVMTRAVEETLNTLVESALTEMQKTKAGRAQLRNIQQWAHNPGATRSGDPAVPPTPAPEHPDAPPPPEGTPGDREDHQDGPGDEHRPSAVQQYQEGAERVEHATMGSIARSVAGVAARGVSERRPNWSQDEATGDLVQYADDGETEVRRIKANEDPALHERLSRTLRRNDALAGNLTRFAAGEGLGGTLGAVIGRAAGPIGMAVGAVSMIGHQLENQNEQASTYRAIYGQEGTGMFAAKDRLQERLAGLQGFGTIGGERAREQFKSASELGLRGEGRDQATDFSSEMYLKYGMDTGESMKFVQASIEQGNLSLKDFGDAIKEVSKAAVEAGHNSAEAIAEFRSTQAQVAQQVVAGPQSIQVSKQLMHTVEGLGLPVANSLGGAQGLAGVLANTNTVNRVAMMSGMNPLAAQFELQSGSSASASMASKIISGSADQVVQMVAAFFGKSPDYLRQTAREKTGGKKDVSNDQAMDLMLQWADGDEAKAGMGLQVAGDQMRSMGYQVDSTQVAQTFVRMVLGGFDSHEKGGHHGPHTGASGVDRTPGNALIGKDGTLTIPKFNVLDNLNKGVYAGGEGGDIAANNAYRDWVSSNKNVGNKAIESLVSGKGSEAIAAYTHGDPAKAKFRVQDGGKSKDVSLSEAISNPKYRPQLVSGDAQLVGPDHQLESVSQITNYKSGDMSAPGKSGGSGGGGGTVRHELVLSGEAKRLLKLHAPSEAQRGGVPAASTIDLDGVLNYGDN